MARQRVAKLFAKRQNLPKRVEVRDLNERTMVKLAIERKHLTDIIKMVAYQAESDLLALLRPHYARADQEGRTLLHELFGIAGEIRVNDSELHITLAPLSSPHRTHAANVLCERDARPNDDDFPRLPPAHALRDASATADRACLSRFASRMRHRHRRCLGSLSGIKTGHCCPMLCQEV